MTVERARTSGTGRPASSVSRYLAMATLGAAVGGAGAVAGLPVAALTLPVGVCTLVAMSRVTLWWGVLIVSINVVSNFVPVKVGTLLCVGSLVLFLASYWTTYAERARPAAWSDRTLWGLLALWFGWGLLSGVQALDRLEALKELARYGLSLAAFFTYLQWLRAEPEVRAVLRIWRVLALVLAARLLLVTAFDAFAPLLGSHPPNERDYAVLFTMLIPVELALLARRQGLPVWLGLLEVAVLLAAVIVSGVRAIALGTVTGVAVLAASKLPRPVRQALVAAGLVAAIGAAWSLVHQGGVPAWLTTWLSGRDRLWTAALAAIREQPIFGVGPGNWAAWFGPRFSQAQFIVPDGYGHLYSLNPGALGGEAHNLLLTKAAEMGPLSALCLVAAGWAWVRAALRAMRSLPAGWRRAVALGCMSAMAGVAAQSFVENGPLLGRGRGSEVALVWLVAALPLALAQGRSVGGTAAGGARA